MRVLTLVVGVLACVISPVCAFSNGTLLPSYLCSVNDGLPKTVGAVIRFFETDHIPDRGYPIAGYHQQKPINATNLFDPVNAVILIPKDNTILVNPTSNYNAIDLTTGFTGARTIYPGQEIALDLITRNKNGLINKEILQAPGKGNGTVAQMLGAFVYAQDANGVRIGRFTAFGPSMQPWLACGPNAVGIVHNEVLNETDALANVNNPIAGGMPIYTGIKWRAPPQLVVGSTITFKGVGVTRFGFGPFTTDYTVVPAPIGIPGTPVISNVLVYGSSAAIFFIAGVSNPIATYTASVTQNTGITTFTSNESPIIIQLNRQVTLASVTITATNTQGTSTVSNPFPITIQTQQTQVAHVIKQLNALCPDQRFAYADEDNQCTWSTSPTNINTVVTTLTGIPNQASHIMSISMIGIISMIIMGVMVE